MRKFIVKKTLDNVRNHVIDEKKIELRRLELEEKTVRQDHEIRLKEIEIKNKASKRSRWANPLAISIVAATIAATGNAYVSWLNGSNQLAIEATRNASQKEIEREKAEAARILEATKGGDPESIAKKIRVLINFGLISDPNRQAALEAYLKPKELGNSLPKSATSIMEHYSSGWLGGGNNQSTQCGIGRTIISQQHPDKTILLKSSSEESKKNVLGQVKYKYFCIFEVG